MLRLRELLLHISRCGACLLSLSNSKKTGVARVGLEMEDEVMEVVGRQAYHIGSCRPLLGLQLLP